jgi:hypothetical protein
VTPIRGIALVILGVGLIAFRRWVAREHLEYLRRHRRDTQGYRAYLELFEDARTAEFLLLVAGIGMLVVGMLAMVLGR